MTAINSTIYIFGKFASGYSQYPDDYTHEMFEMFAEHSRKGTLMTIHRRDSLMYYMFTKRLTDSDKYIGVCFCWNGIKCDSVGELNKLCATEISRWIQNGDIVEISEKGEIVSRTDELYKKVTVIDWMKKELSDLINSSSLVFSDLPPLDYGRSQTESKTIKLGDDSEINEAVNSYSTVYVTSNIQSVSLNTAASKLRKSHEENERLREEVNRLKRAKKQTLTVSILGGFLALAAIAIIGVMSSSDQKSKTIDGLKKTNYTLEARNMALEKDSATLSQTLAITTRNFQAAREQADVLTRRVSNLNQEIENKEREINNLNRDVLYYRNRVSNMESQRTTTPAVETYEVYGYSSSIAYCYYRCGSQYKRTDCYYNDGQTVTVYKQRDGYALTDGGYVRMQDLRKR